jgi:ammonium transporter Rh
MLTGRFFAMVAGNADYPDALNGNTGFQLIQMDITQLLEGDFAAAAVLISFGAVIGKLSPAQLLLMLIFEVPIYSFNKE